MPAPSSRHVQRLLVAGVLATAAACVPLVAADAPSGPLEAATVAGMFPYTVCDTLVADLNGDGRAEFVGGDHFSPGLGVMVNATPRPGAALRFGRFVDVRFGGGAGASSGLAVLDLNGDGRPDLASANHPGNLAVLVNRTPPRSPAIRFAPTTTVQLDAGPRVGPQGAVGGVAAADFDRDGRPDLATTHFSGSTAGLVLNRTPRGAPSARLAAPVNVPVGGNPLGIAAGDLDGDRRPDIVTANVRGGSVTVLLNRRSRAGGVRFVRRDVLVGAGASFVVLTDLDADGRLDVVSANWGDRSLTVLSNRSRAGSGLVLRRTASVRLRSRGLIVRAADLDGDRRPDLVVLPLDPPARTAATVVLNRTSRGARRPRFAAPQAYALPRLGGRRADYTLTGAVGDLDGDGRPEAAAGVAEAPFAPPLSGDLAGFLGNPALTDIPAEIRPSRARVVVLGSRRG